MRAVILANGDPPDPEFARRVAAESDLLIATDGAAHIAAGIGLVPTILSGDFDSVSLEIARKEFPNIEIVPTPDQGMTDMEKALILARSRGADTIAVIGATGSRIDHTIANLLLPLVYGADGSVELLDSGSRLFALAANDGQGAAVEIATWPGDTVSLITPNAPATVSIDGVRWPVEHGQLAPGTRGVSNEALSDKVNIHLHKGSVVIVHLVRHQA